MNTLACIARRRSYRQGFRKDPVRREDLEKILLAGAQAPSGCNKQTTEFIAVDDPALLRELRQVSTMPAVQTAPVLIFCLLDRDPAPAFGGRSFQVEDCAAAVQNMLLAIEELGYASVWVQGGLMGEGKAAFVEEVLGVPHNKTVSVLLPVGVPEESVSIPQKLPLQARAFYNGYPKK